MLIWVLTVATIPWTRRVAQRSKRQLVRARDAAHLVMDLLKPVDRDPDPLQTRGRGLGEPLLRQVAAAALETAFHSGGPDRRDDLQPVLAQIGLAADQADVAGAELGHLGDEVEGFSRAQLVAAPASGARSAMGQARSQARVISQTMLTGTRLTESSTPA